MTSSTPTAATPSRTTTHLSPQPSTSEHIPTVDSPFNFPSQPALPPAYTSFSTSTTLTTKPIAIPQTSPTPTSPFLAAYPPLLLTHGITSQTFLSFLSTISAFLTAKVSDRAIGHAGDMAKSIASQPTTSFKNIYQHAKAVGKDVGKNAKRGNVIGAALGVVGGTVTIPLFAVGGLVASAASLPGLTIAAVVKKPKTPRQRAAAYITVANEKWFTPRGLYAVLLDSQELAEVLKVPVAAITEAQGIKDVGADGQLRGLEAHLESLKVQNEGGEAATLTLGRGTMWLVLSKAVVAEGAEEENGAGSSEQLGQGQQQSKQ